MLGPLALSADEAAARAESIAARQGGVEDGCYEGDLQLLHSKRCRLIIEWLSDPTMAWKLGITFLANRPVNDLGYVIMVRGGAKVTHKLQENPYSDTSLLGAKAGNKKSNAPIP